MSMSMFRFSFKLVVLLTAWSARAAVLPTVLIDYRRLDPAGVAPVPETLHKFSAESFDRAHVAWVAVTRDDLVRVGIIRDGRTHRLEIPHVEVYRAAVGASEELGLAAETLRGLRERRRELVLRDDPEVTSALRTDARVAAELPADADSVHLHYVERPDGGGVRVHLGGAVKGEGFTRAVDFVDFDDFNQVTGLNLGPGDFWPTLISFWRERPHEMTGGFAMKTAPEARVDCQRAFGPDEGPE